MAMAQWAIMLGFWMLFVGVLGVRGCFRMMFDVFFWGAYLSSASVFAGVLDVRLHLPGSLDVRH